MLKTGEVFIFTRKWKSVAVYASGLGLKGVCHAIHSMSHYTCYTWLYMAMSRYVTLCHAIHSRFIHSQKLNGVFASVELQKQRSSFVMKDYITALKLFPVVFCCGWQKWKWIES